MTKAEVEQALEHSAQISTLLVHEDWRIMELARNYEKACAAYDALCRDWLEKEAEIERLKAALAAAPHADDCASLNRFIHTEPCPYWTNNYCLMEKCIHGVMMCEPCEKCAKYEPSTVLTFREGAERCHRALCDCWKSRVSAASDSQPVRDPCWECNCLCHQAGQNRRCDACAVKVAASHQQPRTGEKANG